MYLVLFTRVISMAEFKKLFVLVKDAIPDHTIWMPPSATVRDAVVKHLYIPEDREVKVTYKDRLLFHTSTLDFLQMDNRAHNGMRDHLCPMQTIVVHTPWTASNPEDVPDGKGVKLRFHEFYLRVQIMRPEITVAQLLQVYTWYRVVRGYKCYEGILRNDRLVGTVTRGFIHSDEDLAWPCLKIL
jgi:hypothetical protein